MKKWLVVLFLLAAPAWAIDITRKDGIYHIVLKGEKIKKRIEFIASENLVTNREAHKKSGAILTVNTGFFDPKNEKTVSYIVTGRQTVADPILNENLLKNPVLNQNIDKILNRTELRVLECHDEWKYEIVPHTAPVDFGCTIVTSAQGGPLILPELQLEEEFFVVMEDDTVVRDSASVFRKTARTIAALKDGRLHILIITNDNPMDIYEVQSLCKTLGFERALAFDGGGSTSMNYRKKYNVVSEGEGRKVKSFLIVR